MNRKERKTESKSAGPLEKTSRKHAILTKEKCVK
jgi:hypothetical protein